jgi:hypothetical protein
VTVNANERSAVGWDGVWLKLMVHWSFSAWQAPLRDRARRPGFGRGS